MTKKIFLISLLLVSFLISGQASAEAKNCWVDAGAYYNINPWVLYSIASIESNHNLAALNANTNGTVDVGLMQINSLWFKELKKYNIEKEHLMDGCNAIFVASWILAKRIQAYGSTWKAVGTYHSKTPHLRDSYAEKVYNRYYKLLTKAGYFQKYPNRTIPSFYLEKALPLAERKSSASYTQKNSTKTSHITRKIQNKQKIELKYKQTEEKIKQKNKVYASNNSKINNEIFFKVKENSDIKKGKYGY